MASRRAFLRRVGAAGLTVATTSRMSWAADRGEVIPTSFDSKQGGQIKSVNRREETTVRSGGYGSVVGATWTADDRLLVAIGEGTGWPGLPQDVYFQTALIEVGGAPHSATFEAIEDYPIRSLREWYRPGGDPSYYGGGILAIDQCVYQYVTSTHGSAYWSALSHNDPIVSPSVSCTKLIYSTDQGRTWRNQDGTQPVYFEPPKDQDKGSMIFWDEPRGYFSGGVMLLQMGKGYGDNRDGYVYGYSTVTQDEAEALMLFRVSTSNILKRDQYEFFSGRRDDVSVNWTHDIAACAPVHRFPRNWRCGSVVYNAPLRRYMMIANFFKAIDGGLTDEAEPCVLGMWVASHPWGPWQRIYEESPWRPGGKDMFCYATHIPSKWISADGKSFWMTWTDATAPLAPDTYEKIWFASGGRDFSDKSDKYFHTLANYRFNAQRIDVTLA